MFTPTYNRANTLPKLYFSLLKQNYKNFEWVIVDDGSIDDTQEIVKSWIEEKKINIIYHKKTNGGKHRAINKGLEIANGELFFIVDSDDYLLDSSLSIVDKYYQDIKDDKTIIGVTGFRCFPNNQIIGGKLFPQDVLDSNLIERRQKYNVIADLAHVLKTDIFKQYLFPDIPGENFVAESIVWNRIALDYKMRYFNEAIYVGGYLEGGLSNNSIKNRRINSKYSTLLYKELVDNNVSNIKVKFKAAINYWRFAFCRKENIFKLLMEIKNFQYSLVSLPIGFFFYLKDSINSEIKVNSLNNER
ncbi:glycosyltransferase family A protein [Myroides odoratimimus]|uniref:glycosyltransferase family A protein n=1 Tax=Myroides odoratimimus TaxID=76832 RepID=UPI002575805D|nr:glycosyltransferase family 2 protein [Myroides odoratimimus]